MSFSRRQKLKLLGKLDKSQRHVVRVAEVAKCALHVAAAAHNLEILLFLLSQPNIDVHARDLNYRTALDVARQHSTTNGDKYGFYANCILALEAKSTAAPVAAPPVLATSTDVAQVVLETPEAGGTTWITCTERQRDAVFVPCGHRVLCLTCVGSLSSRRCPLCRASIREFMRTYDS
ncbi:hypothetical protein AC1031_012542 [Aphanomyces cochlioides]|nr:hypothetical protein AC1031_012542 [Aphanomyces cochlioides]